VVFLSKMGQNPNSLASKDLADCMKDDVEIEVKVA